MGGLVGPAVGGLLADMSGLRAPFTLTGMAAAAAAVYGLLRLPETRSLGAARDERVRAAEAAEESTVRGRTGWRVGTAGCSGGPLGDLATMGPRAKRLF